MTDCAYCYGRGYFILYTWTKGVRYSHHQKCTHCSGEWSFQAHVDEELKEALDWFRTSTPPKEPFRLDEFKTVDDPVLFWKNLRSDIARDNIYALEARREDLIGLQRMFGSAALAEDF